MTEANNNTETNKLDNLTVRRFARLLKNDGAKTSSPITTGTVAQNGNSLVVYADGAMIPITQTSTGVNVGDEVMVIYGDDQAYIVGNNTDNNPTASDLMNAEIDAERAAAELIKQERAKIDAETDTVRQKAQDASDKADALEKDLDASNATITDLSTEVGTLGTRVDNAIETANESLSTATEVKQTASDLSAKVDRAYENADEALTQSSTAQQTATEIQTTLNTNYYTKGEIEESYVSESQLTQKANEITTSVKEDIASEYATTKALSEVKQTADGVSQTLTKEYTKTGEDTSYTQQSTFTQTVEGLEASISSTGTDARKYATNYLSFSLNDGLLVGDMTEETLGANTQIIGNGIRIRNGKTVLGSFFDSGITVGQTDTGKKNVYIYDGGILIRVGTTILSRFNSTSIQLGPRDGKNIYFVGGENLSTIIFRQAETELAKITSDTITLGKADEGRACISKDCFTFKDSSGVLAKFTPDDITLGKTDAGCNNTNITADGINLRNGTDVLASFTTDNITLGKTDGFRTMISAYGMYIGDAQSTISSFEKSSVRLGRPESNNVIVDANGMTFYNSATVLARFTPDNVTIGKTGAGEKNTYISTSGIQLRSGTDNLAEFTANDVTIGKISSKNAYISTSGIQLCDGTTALAEFTTDSATIGKTDSKNVVVDTSGLTINNGSTALASFTANKITMGKTGGINATVDSDSFDVCDGSTPCISMGYSETDSGKCATLQTLNKQPLNISVACDLNGDGSWSRKTRSGILSSWVQKDTTISSWHVLSYIPQAEQSYFYAEIIYSGSSAGGSAVTVSYPSNFKLKTNTPYHASVTSRQTGTASSYAGYVEANNAGVYFYPMNTVGSSNDTKFTVFVAGYFTNS